MAIDRIRCNGSAAGSFVLTKARFLRINVAQFMYFPRIRRVLKTPQPRALGGRHANHRERLLHIYTTYYMRHGCLYEAHCMQSILATRRVLEAQSRRAVRHVAQFGTLQPAITTLHLLHFALHLPRISSSNSLFSPYSPLQCRRKPLFCHRVALLLLMAMQQVIWIAFKL